MLVEGYRAIFFQGTFPAPGPLLLAAAASAWSAPLAYGLYRPSGTTSSTRSVIALAVESVTKQYRVRPSGPRTLRDSAVQWLAGTPRRHRHVWALRDVSFTVERGESLGVVGHNGAGKSTLLRLLCGVSSPRAGRIARRGHVSGLLELGGGFHLDLSGRDNIVTAGVLAGLTEAEVRARSTSRRVRGAGGRDRPPVRTYSSGMYLRLAFSVALQFDPEILVIDEVLAVGDSRFQQKCLARIAGFRAPGGRSRRLAHPGADPEPLRRGARPRRGPARAARRAAERALLRRAHAGAHARGARGPRRAGRSPAPTARGSGTAPTRRRSTRYVWSTRTAEPPP